MSRTTGARVRGAVPGLRRARRPQVAIAIGLAVSVVLAACGSRLPDEVLLRMDEAALGGGERQVAGAPRAATGVPDDVGIEAPELDAGGAVTEVGAGPAEGAAEPVPTADGAEDPGDAGAAAGPCAGGASDVGVTPNEIKVASIVTASGPLPGATEGAYRGAAAYIAKANAEGGVCGRRITLLKGDDGLDPQRARGEFLRLEPDVLAMVGSFSVADSGYIDLIESTGVPYVGTSVDPAGRELANVVPRFEQGVAHTGPFAYLRQAYPDARRVGLLFADVGGVRSNIPGFQQALTSAGYDVVYTSGASPTQVDFTSEVINLRQRNVDMIYLFAFEVSMHVRMARAMRQQSWEPQIKLSNIGYSSLLVDLLGPIAEGWMAHMTHLPMLNPDEPARSPALAEFLTWHERLFPGTPIDLFPVTAWGDAARFVEALRQAGGDPTRADIIDLVAGLPEDDGGGIFAPTFPAEQRGASCFVVTRVTGGQWVREHPDSGYECAMGERIRF